MENLLQIKSQEYVPMTVHYFHSLLEIILRTDVNQLANNRILLIIQLIFVFSIVLQTSIIMAILIQELVC